MTNTYQDVIGNMQPDVYQQLKESLELSKWPNGTPLTQEQKEHCMQAIIAYEHRNLPANQHTGYVELGKKVTERGVELQPINLIDILDPYS